MSRLNRGQQNFEPLAKSHLPENLMTARQRLFSKKRASGVGNNAMPPDPMTRRFQFSLRALLVWPAIPAIFYAGMAIQSKLDEQQKWRQIDQTTFYKDMVLDYERQLQFLTGKLEMQQGEIESLRKTRPAKYEPQE
ncbi:MAG TPA: hypothetical protein VHC22_07010 [Pirellulales bacterium]|nr:hypothetical protein [Pirellulales bacterium]